MKTKTVLFIIALTCLICGGAAAQRPNRVPFVNDQNAKPLTDLELFQDSYGAALIKGFTEFPRIRATSGSILVLAVEFRNASNKTRVKGVAIDISLGEQPADRARSFIEYGELDALIKGINYVSKVDKDATQLQNLEAVYTTKGEFSISNYFTYQGEPRIAVSVGRYEPKTVFIDQSGQTSLLGVLQQAKTTLDELKL
jgi:hypothetical protein